MKMSSFLPEDQVFWYLNKQDINQLRHDVSTDIVIIGGGMAGLSAAQTFRKKGLKVVLLEKNYCGAGASGKSSGFITPNAELSLNSIIQSRGAEQAKKLWEFITTGSALIQTNIEQYALECDYQKMDTLILASTQKTFASELTTEYNARQQLGYESKLYQAHQLTPIIGSQKYYGALAYADTFAIKSYAYCHAMKEVLTEQGIYIYEETPVIAIENHIVTTPYAKIRAQHIIVCTDHFTNSLESFRDKVYHVQTFLMASAPLSEAQIQKIFPTNRSMVWDTEQIYNYYRLTGENRLLLGGSSLFDTYAQHATHDNKRMVKKLTGYFNEKFPGTAVQFEYIWPGLIGVSKDLFPLAGPDRTMPSVYYVAAAAGLPWAAALGIYSAERIVDNNTSLDHLLSPERNFTFGPLTQKILGTPLTFALSNFLTAGSL